MSNSDNSPKTMATYALDFILGLFKSIFYLIFRRHDG